MVPLRIEPPDADATGVHPRPAPTAPALPTIRPGMDFDEACAAVLDHLIAAVPLGSWAVTRFDGVRQRTLAVRDAAEGSVAGDAQPWADSFCIHMAAGRAPQIAPDATAVPAYAAAGAARRVEVGAYVGVPIRRADGSLFGTLRGLDPRPAPEDLHRHAPLLDLLAELLSTILAVDSERTEVARARERAELAAATDVVTGLVDRRGWDRHLALEEPRIARFGDPAGVVVVGLEDGAGDDAGDRDAGDRRRRAAGRALRHAVRSTDVVGRLGVDELGVVAADRGTGDQVRLVGRIAAALTDAGVAASIGHAPHTLAGGLTGALAAARTARDADGQRRHQRRAERWAVPGRAAGGRPGGTLPP